MPEKILQIDKSHSASHILDNLFQDAFEKRASDIHIDPTVNAVSIRFRVDGSLCQLASVNLDKHQEIISRIKILSGLRIDEHNRAQDGRLRVDLSGDKFADIRVSILPSYHGESAVLRLLFDHDEALSLSSLGFNEKDLLEIKKAISKSSGMILITGPTGSGKTTTLYSLIKALNNEENSIVTIEEPIEYAVPGVRQIQVNYKGELNFANGLRSILRQDPNVIMVGEIRDKETASLAVNTALTGHLLLSTLHTSDAAATLPRLIDLAVEPFLLASTFTLAINQRLVKKICRNCVEKIEIKERLDKTFGEELLSDQFFKGKGCSLCHGSGYNGRMLVAECLTTSEGIRESILRKDTVKNIRNLGLKNGMTSILEDGLQKAKQGLTTLEEIFKVIHE